VSTGTRVPLADAELVAVALASTLQPACERIQIAGSIRRQRADVGDIELVAVPRIETLPEGMFGVRSINRLTERLDMLTAAGVLAPHPIDPKRGERYSKLLDAGSGLQVDVFSATRETFGLILLIRTGPANYSQRFVTAIRGRPALHVAGGQLHRGSLGCGAYECEVVPTPEEADVYAAADWPFAEPETRA
jgi:DNA polymerase/3'-5' exonuclease PolX